MGTHSAPSGAPSGIADALFSRVQQRVLGLLFGNPGRSFYAKELIHLAGSGSGAVQRELARLTSAGLVSASRIGNQVHYRANASSPVFHELRGIVVKTSGVVDVIRAALAPLADDIDASFVFGSVAKGIDDAASDVDLMIIADEVRYPETYAALDASTRTLGRTVNPTIYSREDLLKRLSSGSAFLTKVLAGPKLWVIGDESTLAANEADGESEVPPPI